jgi:hypothetical protein
LVLSDRFLFVHDYSKPIATAAEFKRALLALRPIAGQHMDMLRAQFRADRQTITATMLASEADYANYRAANSQYGTFAHKLADALGYRPPVSASDGNPQWWRTICGSASSDPEINKGDIEMTMRPELVTAISELRWFNK